HMIGELEATLKGTRSDTAVKNFGHLLIPLLALLTRVGQHVLMSLDRNIVLREARDRHRDAVGVLARALYVVRRIGLAAIELPERVEHAEKPVETDGRTVERGKIDMTHGLSSC